ncbi:MAG TPA: hypothetical protein VFH27_16355 [Longimicrobiaceae bacterium]|nr:hypothetical protein [Longimicrobiaceae bacterium]
MDPREGAGREPRDEAPEDRQRNDRRQTDAEFRVSHRGSRAAAVERDDTGFDFGLRGEPMDAAARRRPGRRVADDDFELTRNY